MKMFLDDIREPKNNYDVIVRNYDEAINSVKQKVFHLLYHLIMI